MLNKLTKYLDVNILPDVGNFNLFYHLVEKDENGQDIDQGLFY